MSRIAALFAVCAPTHNLRTIWQLLDWPNLSYDAAALAAPLAQVHRAQGQLMGRMAELGMAQREQATGYSGRVRITVAAWRTDASGPMEVVSGAVGREKVHFTAPPAATLRAQSDAFFKWFAAVPVGDMALARAEGNGGAQPRAGRL